MPLSENPYLTPIVPDLPVTIYTPESPVRHPVQATRDLFASIHAGRGLAWRLFIRDLSAQYRQTYFGYLWALLPPLVASLTFIFLQSQGITRIEGTPIPYAAFAMIGTLLWQTFVDSISSPVTSILNSKAVLAKINLPREAILFSGLLMVLFNTLIRLVLLAGVMVWWKITPGFSLVLFPFALLGLMLAGFAIGLMILPVGALYGDVARSLPIITQFWMLLTPVVYPARTQGLAGMLSVWNPVSPLITTAREALSGLAFTQLPAFLVVTTAALILSLLGLLAYRLLMPILIERMGG